MKNHENGELRLKGTFKNKYSLKESIEMAYQFAKKFNLNLDKNILEQNNYMVNMEKYVKSNKENQNKNSK